MMHQTLAQERRVHWLTIEMGNYCGQQTNTPGGTRASSLVENVNCPDCLRIVRGGRGVPWPGSVVAADAAGARMAETLLYGPRDMPLDEDGT